MEQLRASPLMKYMQPGTASMLHLEAHTRDNYAQPRVSSKEFKHFAAGARAAANACQVQRRNAKLEKVAERQMVPAPMPISALDDVTMATLQMYNPMPHVMLIAQVTREQVGYAAPPELPAGPAAAPPAPAMPPPPPLPPLLAPPVPLVPPPPADVQVVPPPPAVSVSPPTQVAAAATSTSLSVDDLAERIDDFPYTARSGGGGDAADAASGVTCLQAAYSGNVSAGTAPQPQQIAPETAGVAASTGAASAVAAGAAACACRPHSTIHRHHVRSAGSPLKRAVLEGCSDAFLFMS